MGFKGGSINSIVKTTVEEDSDEEMSDMEEEQQESGEKILDPRAGRVNVELPQIKFRAKDVAEMLLKQKSSPETCTKGAKAITRLVDNFTKLSKGKYPLGIKQLKLPKHERPNVKAAAKTLLEFEEELMGVKKTKKRKRKPVSSPSEEDTTIAPPKKKKKKKTKLINKEEQTTIAPKIKKKKKPTESVLVQNPFSTTPIGSPTVKKVKINMKLNMSQEFHEHCAKVTSSPVIPFDANKKPAKPLLKPSPVTTPINPFYKRLKL